MSFFNGIRPDPGFVSPVRSDPDFVSPVQSDPGFVSPIRSDPVRSGPVRSWLCQRAECSACDDTMLVNWAIQPPLAVQKNY